MAKTATKATKATATKAKAKAPAPDPAWVVSEAELDALGLDEGRGPVARRPGRS